LDDGSSTRGDFAKGSCRSTGGGASFGLAVSSDNIGDKIIATREIGGTKFDLSIKRGDTPVEGRDIDAEKARAEVDQRTVEFFNTHAKMAEVPTINDFLKKVVDDASGCAPREDQGTSDDSPRKPRSSTGDAGGVPSAKEESSDKAASEPKDKNEEKTEMEIDYYEEEAAKISLTRDVLIKPAISVTQGEGPPENDPNKIDMGDSQGMKFLEVSADLKHENMAVSKMRIDEHETASGSNGITRSLSCLEPETAEQDDLSDDYGLEVFELLTKRRRKKRRKNVDTSKSISISIPSHTPQGAASTDTKTAIGFGNAKNVVEDKIWPIDEVVLDEDDPNSFYSTTHEGEDPQYVEFRSLMMKNRLQAQLVKIQKDKKEDMKKIQAYLSFTWEESNDALQGEIKKIRDEIVAKQTRQRKQLTDKHKGQSKADEQKLNEGENWLVQKQHLEMQQSVSQHAGMLGWNEIAAQLQNRHAYQRHQFEERKVEMKKRSEQEINTQNQILEAHHKKRNAESQLFIKELTDKCHKQHNNLKAKLLRLHEVRFEQKRKEAEANFGRSQSDTLARGNTDANQNYPCAEKPNDCRQTKEELIKGVVSHDAAMRQKQRKSLMNNASIQLAIEIHNEGMSCLH
jgi:hypothetical protein